LPPPKKFSYKPFDPVACDSSADFAGYRNAKPGPICSSRKYQRDENIILKSAATSVQTNIIGTLQNSVGLFEGTPQKTSHPITNCNIYRFLSTDRPVDS
jgi:hypothetical protein